MAGLKPRPSKALCLVRGAADNGRGIPVDTVRDGLSIGDPRPSGDEVETPAG